MKFSQLKETKFRRLKLLQLKNTLSRVYRQRWGTTLTLPNLLKINSIPKSLTRSRRKSLKPSSSNKNISDWRSNSSQWNHQSAKPPKSLLENPKRKILSKPHVTRHNISLESDPQPRKNDRTATNLTTRCSSENLLDQPSEFQSVRRRNLEQSESERNTNRALTLRVTSPWTNILRQRPRREQRRSLLGNSFRRHSTPITNSNRS